VECMVADSPFRSRGRWAVGLAAALVVAVGVPAPSAGSAGDNATGSVRFHPGAPSLHDPGAPGLGNGGYLISHYGIRLSYRSPNGELTGSTVITAKATEDLSRFTLDFALPSSSVRLNGRPVNFQNWVGPKGGLGHKLVITPRHGIRSGSTMTLRIRYRARPSEVRVSYEGSLWLQTPTGVDVWNEPNPAAEWWYPGNDYPTDKATYDVTVTAPLRDVVISNGRRVSLTRHGSIATAHWRMSQPMASYLSFLAIGRYQVVRTTSPGHVPTMLAYERGGGALIARARRAVAQTPAVLAFLRRHWGPYPFSAAGGIVTSIPGSGAFESQSRPNYEAGLWRNQEDGRWVVVHENAHQWFGDSVTAANWEQFWLAEGFAMYSEWLWSQAQHDGTAERLFLSYYHLYPRHDVFWRTPVVPSSSSLPTQIYFRGAMTLQALRNRVGTRTFYAILHQWLRSHRHQNGLTPEFVHLAEHVSGYDLSTFFHTWLYSRTRPAPTRQNGFPAGTRRQLSDRPWRNPRSLSDISASVSSRTTPA
jgi:aminopeptidase N